MLARLYIDDYEQRHVWFERQSLRDYFAFPVSGQLWRDDRDMTLWKQAMGLSRFFFVPIYDLVRDEYLLAIAPLALLILAKRWLLRAWFAPARALGRRGYLPGLEPGIIPHWFWPRYIARKR